MTTPMPTFAQLNTLALKIVSGSLRDDRPQWLVDMPSANDNTAMYYPFFYQMMRQFGAGKKVLEIGTYRASSAAHLAYGAAAHPTNPAIVCTIDINPESKLFADEVQKAHDLPLVALTLDAGKAVDELAKRGPFDFLFIDANHTFNQCYDEYAKYRPLVKDGGMIFFDDIALPMATHEMDVLWEFVLDPKLRLDMLHYTGFGVAVKDANIEVGGWFTVIKRATKRMEELAAANPRT